MGRCGGSISLPQLWPLWPFVYQFIRDTVRVGDMALGEGGGDDSSLGTGGWCSVMRIVRVGVNHKVQHMAISVLLTSDRPFNASIPPCKCSIQGGKDSSNKHVPSPPFPPVTAYREIKVTASCVETWTPMTATRQVRSLWGTALQGITNLFIGYTMSFDASLSL